LQYYSVSLEGRYYFDEAFKHWYIGGNIAGSRFIAQKWNYWSDSTLLMKNGNVYQYSDVYQKGYSIILELQEAISLNLLKTGTWIFMQESELLRIFTKAMSVQPGARYDVAEGFNKSGEILPYRGGVMISYKLK
jgi:hypothetical protein